MIRVAGVVRRLVVVIGVATAVVVGLVVVLMVLSIVKKSLQSRSARTLITGGVTRVISLFPNFDGDSGGGGGILSRIFNPLSRIAGFLFSSLSWISIRITDIFSWLLTGLTRLSSFDWNASDQRLIALQENQNLSMAAIWGATVGEGLGWLAGIGVGYGVGLLCPVIGGASLARYISTRIVDEALGSLAVGLRNAILATVGTLGNNLLVSAYMQYRRLLKVVPRGVLSTIYGEETADFIKNIWGNEGGPVMTFSGFIEESIQEIDSDALRVFVQNLLDEGWETFIEAGFIIAYELDTALTQTRQAQNDVLGQERAVVLQPDIRGDEKLVITGKEELAKQTIDSALNVFQFVQSRDVGQIVGSPVNDYLITRPLMRKLNIVFRNYEKPPWTTRENRLKEVSYAIPDVRVGISWQELKQAARSYTWGPYRATAKLVNGRQMAVYGGSKAEAEDALYRLLSLSTTSIMSLTVSEERVRHPDLRKTPVIVYPAFAHLLVRRSTFVEGDYTNQQGERFSEERSRILLWPEEEPADFVPIN